MPQILCSAIVVDSGAVNSFEMGSVPIWALLKAITEQYLFEQRSYVSNAVNSGRLEFLTEWGFNS